MAIKAIGQGTNRRRQTNMPWWARNFKAVAVWLSVTTLIIMGFFSYATWLAYLLIEGFKAWFKGLVQKGVVIPYGQQVGLTWPRVLDWTKALPTTQLNNPWLLWGLLFGTLTVGLVWTRIIRTYRLYTGNEKGAESFTDPNRLKKEYQLIPDRIESFPGYGGMPLAHYNGLVGFAIQQVAYHAWGQKVFKALATDHALMPSGQYAIDQTTVNNLIYGITRSGKGETLMLPLIDILSRAEKQCSMMVNDPKGEMFQMSMKMLESRGYRVHVLNLQNMDKSMSYNPLAIVVAYAKQGYYDEAQREANRISTAIYGSDEGGKDKFWSNSSINLLNAMIFSQLDLAERHQSWQRVTMNNIYHELTELGGKKFYKRIGSQMKEISYLTAYFDLMGEAPQTEFSEMALQAFQQSRFAGNETQGSIYASMMEGIKLYQQRDIARLTSLNSLDFREMAFPRQLRMGFPSGFSLQTATVTWFDQNGELLEKRKQMLDRQGFIVVPIKTKLPVEFKVNISFDNDLTAAELRQYNYCYSGKIGFKRDTPLATDDTKYNGKLQLIPEKSTCLNYQDSQVIDFKYSEQPIALFLVTPPHNPAYNQIVSFAVDQAFNQMYQMALDNDRKCVTRVHFVIDEGGNLPKIQDLGRKFSIGLGSELLFDFVLQNKEQLEINYSPKEAATIISNCGNTLYILSKDKATQQEISDGVGQTTVNIMSRQMRGQIDTPDNLSSSLEGVPVISTAELAHLKMGEMVVLRATARTDQKGRLIRSNPIFDTGKTRMPSRWQFLNQTFDDQANVNDIAVATPHKHLDLKTIQYDYISDNEDCELKQMSRLAEKATAKATVGQAEAPNFNHMEEALQKETDPADLQQKIINTLAMGTPEYESVKQLTPEEVMGYLIDHMPIYENYLKERLENE